MLFQCMNKEVNTLKSECLETFAQVEDCKMKSQRNSRPEYLQLLRSKSLDPASMRTMHEVHQLYHYLDNGIRDVNSILDAVWEKFQAQRKGSRRYVLLLCLLCRSHYTVGMKNIVLLKWAVSIRIDGLSCPKFYDKL
jgi:hypothetical protein